MSELIAVVALLIFVVGVGVFQDIRSKRRSDGILNRLDDRPAGGLTERKQNG